MASKNDDIKVIGQSLLLNFMRGASVVVSKNDDIKSLVKVNSLCSLRVARVTMLTFLPHCEVI